MTIIIFILVLVALIVVHEFGHFVVAKLSGMRVDEFGIGYPPRVWAIRKGETEYSLNWIPFGGFVKIYGEDETAAERDERGQGAEGRSRAFYAKPKILQALTLFAGIGMNLLLAYVLITITLAFGTPRALAPSEVPTAKDVALMVASTVPGSPAALAGFMPGDRVLHASVGSAAFSGADADAFTKFVGSDTAAAPISITVDRSGKQLTLLATPHVGLVSSEPTRPALGVAIATTGTIAVPWYRAPLEGARLTWAITRETAIGLWHFFASIATFSANLSEVSGPVGIAGAVGGAAHQGLSALLSIMAIISINLALINILPIPALDGGRLLFVLIETVTRRPIHPKFANTLNTVGFGLLLLLMLVVTAHDIFKIFA